jgi:LysR family glycine cleavage system transcriptional activator
MSDWMPSLNALRAFEAVSRHLSYPAAAAELGVTPAAVKQLVAKLETALAVRLVERRGRGLALTPVGASGKTGLGLAMRHMADAVQTMRSRTFSTRLIVSVEASFATAWLVPKLEAFRERHPSISVLIDSAQKIVDLRADGVDVAIRYGVPADDSLITIRLLEDHVFPACSPSLLAGPPEIKTIDQLRRAPLIHWDLSNQPWSTAARRWYDWGEWVGHVGLEGVDTGRGLRFNDYGLAMQAATSGRGFVLASWPTFRDLFDAGLLVRPFPESVLDTRTGYDVVTTAEAAKRPEVIAFTDWLIDVAGDD